ncbi:MAG: hypothetical protein LBC12_03800 [Nitrososphaerota archaeon]|jgi:hypothetical protein|nr:hypothetical protein [Nitrososphaerota archaeon]
MTQKELRNKTKLYTLTTVFSVLMLLVSVVCVAALQPAIGNVTNGSPLENVDFENLQDPLFSYPTLDIILEDPVDPMFSYPMPIVPPIAHLELEDLYDSHVEITCRVYNCPMHTQIVFP